MRMNKILSVILAAAMTAGMSVCASAQGYATGDVDMDGVITGHDTALIAKEVEQGTVDFTSEQVALADVNGDGTITMEDADELHLSEDRMIGDVDQDGYVGINDAYLALSVYAGWATGNKADYSDADLNAMDVDADGTVTLDDAYEIIMTYSYVAVGHYATSADAGYYYTLDQFNKTSAPQMYK